MTGIGVGGSIVLFLCGYTSQALGFAVGVVASLFNCLLLSRQLQRLADQQDLTVIAPHKGLLLRLFLAGTLLFVSRIWLDISLFAAIAGFSSFQVLLVLQAAYGAVHNRLTSVAQQERGE